MKLKSLEIQGFKTFCDKTKIEFEDGISAVVGPNGSGKSNVSDALRWVLGEQSVKKLRCAKLEDVIFAGSVSKKAQGVASVKLIFDNKDKTMSNLDDEVSILRKYYRNGDSEYFINMKSVRLKDINELFMDTGLGKDGYSIIGQGGIDAIIKAKPSERREIFEEAAGISGCKYKKEDAETRLKKADENLLRIKDILFELESRVGPLKKQADDAKVYMEYFEQKKALEVGLWVKEIDFCKIKLDESKEKLNTLKNSKLNLEETLFNLEKNIEESASNGTACLLRADELRRTLSELDLKLSDEKGRLLLLNNNIKSNTDTTVKLENEISENAERTLRLQETMDQKLKLFNEKEEELNAKRQKLNNDIKNFEGSKDKFCNHENEWNDIKSVLEVLEKDKNEKSIKAAIKESDIKGCESRNEEIKALILNKEGLKRDIEAKISTKETEANSVSTELNTVFEELEGFKKGFSEKRREYENLEKTLQKLRLDSEGELRKIRLLEDLDRNMEGLSRGVKSVILKAREGRLKGVIGAVADALKVEPKYAVAIDISLGAAVQNIITEDETAAKNAINFLKEEKLGRATFLPLTAINGKGADTHVVASSDGFIGLASDLCECEKRFEGIKLYLLGRTLIADNIDSAIKISKKLSGKLKIVTLDGQVVNAGGSMTGGFVSAKTGLIGRAGEIKRLKEGQKELEKRVKEAQKDLEDAGECIKNEKKVISEQEQKLENLKSKKSLIFTELSKMNSERAHYDTGIDELEKEKKIQLDKKLKLTEEMNSLAHELNEAKKKIDETKLKLSQMTELNSKISKENELKSMKIQEDELKLVSMEKELEILNVEISALKGEKKEKAQRQESLALEIENLKCASDEAARNIVTSEENIRALEKEKEGIYIEIDKSKTERESFEKLSMELRKEEKERSRQNELLIKDISRIEEAEKIVQKDYDRIVAGLWDEYEMTLEEAKNISGDIEDINKVKKELKLIKLKLKGLGNVNISAIEEYKEVNERYSDLKEQVDDIELSKKELIGIINSLNKDMKTMFLNRFNEINQNFSQIIRELFGGGSGKLILEDKENMLSCGINISVQIPGKKEINLEALSGGEKALVAISLYFAIIKVNPPPFCVLDEIEAALDDVNVERFAKYLRKVCGKTQFIVITHRRGTMEEADALYGVTMEDEGISKLLELRLKELVKA